MYRAAYAPRQRLPTPADTPLLVFPSPNASVSDVSEFTLLEGSSSSFVWSDDDIIESPVQHSRPASPPPHPALVYRRPVPLLAFIASLLAVDDATRQLLEHPSHCSSLFPGPALAPPAPEADTPDTQHGLFRLLRHRRRGCCAL